VNVRLEAPPGVVTPCATCGDLTGRGYPSCPGCAEIVDRPWLDAWAALPAADPAEVVAARLGTYPWQCVDWALRLLRCPGCGGELAAGAPDCAECATADSTRWLLYAGPSLPLRHAVTVLRAPSWWRPAVASTWRLALPFVLAGEHPTGLAEVRTQVLAGRYEELAASHTWPPPLHPLPWRP
jgi:hypothetical protein